MHLLRQHKSYSHCFLVRLVACDQSPGDNCDIVSIVYPVVACGNSPAHYRMGGVPLSPPPPSTLRFTSPRYSGHLQRLLIYPTSGMFPPWRRCNYVSLFFRQPVTCHCCRDCQNRLRPLFARPLRPSFARLYSRTSIPPAGERRSPNYKHPPAPDEGSHGRSFTFPPHFGVQPREGGVPTTPHPSPQFRPTHTDWESFPHSRSPSLPPVASFGREPARSSVYK